MHLEGAGGLVAYAREATLQVEQVGAERPDLLAARRDHLLEARPALLEVCQLHISHTAQPED